LIEKLYNKSITQPNANKKPIDDELDSFLMQNVPIDASNKEESNKLGSLYFLKYNKSYPILTELALSILCIINFFYFNIK